MLVEFPVLLGWLEFVCHSTAFQVAFDFLFESPAADSCSIFKRSQKNREVTKRAHGFVRTAVPNLDVVVLIDRLPGDNVAYATAAATRDLHVRRNTA